MVRRGARSWAEGSHRAILSKPLFDTAAAVKLAGELEGPQPQPANKWAAAGPGVPGAGSTAHRKGEAAPDRVTGAVTAGRQQR